MQRKGYMEQRSISPVLEPKGKSDRGEYLSEEDTSTLDMFSKLIVGNKKKLAALEHEGDEKYRQREEEDGEDGEDTDTSERGRAVARQGSVTETEIGAESVGVDNGNDSDEVVNDGGSDQVAAAAAAAVDNQGYEEGKEIVKGAGNVGDKSRKNEAAAASGGGNQIGGVGGGGQTGGQTGGQNGGGPNNNRGRPSSCVFVASLCSNKTDDELCVSVTKHFSQWGKLSTVKVLRDPSNRPYAFVQYTNDNDSKQAIMKGHNSILDGRSLRCEAAKVNRTVFVTSKFAKSEKSCKEMLEEFGEIEQLLPSDEVGNYKNYKYCGGKSSKYWFCKYVYRDDAIRAFANLSESSSFHIEWAQNIETIEQTAPEARSKFDKFSIFVGQLNPYVTEEELVNRFKIHGTVDEVTIVRKASNTFGFIRYKDESSAASAVERENHSMFKDKTMHVQYREVHTGFNKAASKNYGVALAPPPINLKKRGTQGFKKSLDLRKASPFNHQVYPMPMPIPIPPKKGLNGYSSNNYNKLKPGPSLYQNNSTGKKKYTRYGENFDKYKTDLKEESPTPPESVQTYDSHTVAKSGYSPSSAVNSESSDVHTAGGAGKNYKLQSGKNKNVPYFYYIPSNEVPPVPSAGKFAQPYYNPYQYYVPFEPSHEYQAQNGYGIPFPMYFPPANNDQEYNFEESFDANT